MLKIQEKNYSEKRMDKKISQSHELLIIDPFLRIISQGLRGRCVAYLDISPFRLDQFEDAFFELLAIRELPIGRGGYRLRGGDAARWRRPSDIGRGRC